MATSKNTKPGITRKSGMVNASGITIQNLTIRPVERTSLDIQKWRNAHKEAEAINGRRISIYDLYKDVLLDGFLKRMMAKRIAGVTTHRLRFLDKSGKAVDAADNLLKSASFRRLRRALLLQKAWGITVVELGNDNGNLTLFDVPKKHIRAVDGTIVLDQSDTNSSIEYRKPPYSNTVVEVGEWDDLGYLLEAAAYVIYKRGGVADWANFAQIFGMPFREARYDGFNEQVRIQLEKALEKAGSAAYAVLPKEAELTFHESKNTGSNAELFDGLRRAMNEEIMVLVLGATETTTSSKSSGYAQSETHKQTVDEVAEDDRADELAIMNEKVKPVLQYLGLLPTDGQFAYEEQIDVMEAGKKVDVAIKLRNAGVPVSDDWFYETTGIPKPENYEELKAEFQARKQAELAAAAAQPPAKKTGNKSGGKLSATEDKLELLIQRFESFFGEAL